MGSDTSDAAETNGFAGDGVGVKGDGRNAGARYDLCAVAVRLPGQQSSFRWRGARDAAVRFHVQNPTVFGGRDAAENGAQGHFHDLIGDKWAEASQMAACSICANVDVEKHGALSGCAE